VSVTVLYCEGNAKSIDIQVIGQLIPKGCTVQAIGGKEYGFWDKVISDRSVFPKLAGLGDRDLVCEASSVNELPLRVMKGETHLGWVWERKEIENYLIDPRVVERALGRKAPPIEQYQNILKQAAETIAAYTAARTALECFSFSNSWGEQIAKTHRFPPRDQLGKKKCAVKIEEIVVERLRHENRAITPGYVVAKFEELLPTCRPSGFRFEHFLTFFGGKDLLHVMTEPLRGLNFDPSNPKISPTEMFLERILVGIERSQDVWNWLPEWQELRQQLIDF
jgi:hypothetical protein